MIRAADLIAIFDATIEQSSKLSSQYVNHAKEHGQLEIVDVDEVKSIVLTTDHVYYSPISSSTLKRRLYQVV